MKPFVALFSLLLLLPSCFAADKDKKDEKPKAAESIEELQQQVEKILKDTHTPGVAVAIVHKEGPEWVAGLGLSDVAANRQNTPDTLFRIGSTSKAFTSLSILLLADQGKVSLEDSVHKLAPDLWFENRWESTDPIRVVNLLEHTTGWDDLHLREYAKDAPPSMTTLQGLDYDHTSRTSRWRPGTRMAYCNSGPPAAAYVVEKLTGERIEDFVQKNLFLPIGMKTATYFPPPNGTGTTLYHNDGKTPYPYWNILERAAGSINASAKDMAAYVQFYLNRGAVSGKQIVSASDIDRMEVPTSTWASKEGMKAGYGLSNYWSINDGFVYHGHDGGVEGGLTDMSYMPDHNVGYFFSINSGNGDAFDKIGKAIRAYITHKLPKPDLPAVVPLPPNAADYAGWYEPDSPRVEMFRFMERLIGLSRVTFQDGKLVVSSVVGRRKESFLPVTAAQFRSVPEKDPPQPVPTLELLTVNTEGRFIQAEQGTMKMIPRWLAIGEFIIAAFVLLSLLSVIVYAPFWLLGGISKKRRRPAERSMRLWPLIAVVSLLIVVAVVTVSGDDFIERMGNFTGWSFMVFLATLAFAISSIASVLAVWRSRKEGVRPAVKRFSLIVSLALLMATSYLAYYGIIGLRTWA
jgi:CubicO group peptidase (beta-lactamase class C family)